MRYVALAIPMLVLCAPALAQDASSQPSSEPAPEPAPLPAVVFGEVGYGGSGCPDGTAFPIVSPDGQAATLVLREYSVGDGRSIDRKTCAVAVPVEVPDGVQVAVRSAAVRGNAVLPAELSATLTVEAFLAGAVGEPEETTLTGPLDAPLLALTSIAEDDLAWAGCGEDVNLRLNTSLRTRGGEGAEVGVRAINLFWLATRAC